MHGENLKLKEAFRLGLKLIIGSGVWYYFDGVLNVIRNHRLQSGGHQGSLQSWSMEETSHWI